MDISDEAIAAMIAAQARRDWRPSEKLELNRGQKVEKAPKDINKSFLANTIRDVEAHNRREQVDACWRAHGLIAATKALKRKRGDDDLKPGPESEREIWARRKLEALTKPTISEEICNQDNFSSSSSDSDSSSDRKKKKKDKKSNKKHSKKEKKSKKHKKRHKHEKDSS